MRSEFTKRLSAAIVSLTLCAGLLNAGALAAETVNDVKEKTGSDGSIVVTVYNNAPSGSAGTGGQTTVTDADPVEGVGINALRIGSVAELTSTDENGAVSTQTAFGLSSDICDLLGLNTNDAIAEKDAVRYFAPTDVQTALRSAAQTGIEAYLNNADHGAVNQVTGADGAATFSNLPYGLYLLAKSKLPADATTDLAPFLVSVPMYVEGAGWNPTVYAYPKVRTDDIEITKAVNDADRYVNAGQTLTYTVTAAIPAAATGNGSANEFTSFVITDANANSTLHIEKSTVEVKLGTNALTPTEDYTADYENGVLTIALTDTAATGGLAELNRNLGSRQTIAVTYNAAVSTNAVFSTRLTNTAKATYQRSGMPAAADTNTASVYLYTYGIDLTKTLSDGGAIAQSTISFELYKTNNGGTLGDKIPVKSGAGGYWAAAAEETTPVVMYVGVDGKLDIYGLEPGSYYLKEAAAMEGYTPLAEPIAIVIADEDGDGTATAAVNGAAAQVTNGAVSLSVENTKNQTGFTLPQTGGTGTLLATAVGLGLLCAAVILLVIYRRKDRNGT